VRKIAECPKCGNSISENSEYCPGCGTYIGAQETTIITPRSTTAETASTQTDTKQNIPFYKKKWTVAAIISAVVLILFCCLGSAIAGIYFFKNKNSSKDYQTQAKEFYEELKNNAEEIDSSIKKVETEQDIENFNDKICTQRDLVKKALGDLGELNVSSKDQDSCDKFKKALDDYDGYLDKLDSGSKNPLNLDLAEETGDIEELTETAANSFDNFIDASPFIKDSDKIIITKSKSIIDMLEHSRVVLALLKIEVKPNPFSPNDDGKDDTTTIYFKIPKSSIITVQIFDVSGELLKILKDGEKATNMSQQVNWSGNNNVGLIMPNGTYSFIITAEFDNTSKSKEGTLSIEGVAVVCSDCAGTGRIRCSTCGGSGTLTCKTCGARGWVMCGDCEGNGVCRVCGGDGGYYTELGWFTCDNCGGSGVCPRCNGTAGVDCGKCGGDGRINCSTCNGSGAVGCPTCGGDGRL